MTYWSLIQIDQMKNIIITISLTIHIILLILTHTYAAEKVVVGIYENIPLCFSDKHNHAQGIYIDVLNYIATVHHWRIHYKIYRWNDCIKALKSHEIDLMCCIAETPERKKAFFFSQENVMLDWGQIYLPKTSDIHSILDLDNKRIATVKGGILKSRLQKLAKDFDISCEFVLVDGAHDVLNQIETNRVDAGTVLRLFGMRFSSQHNIKPSPIIFAPLHLRIATGNPNKKYLLEMIDSQLTTLKDLEGSAYYQTLNRWLIHSKNKWFIPKWFYWILCVVFVLVIFLLITSLILKYQVAQRTLQLNQQNNALKKNEHLLRTIADNYPHSYVSIIEKDMKISFSSGQEFQRMNHSPENYIGKHVRDIFGKHADFIIQQYQKTFSGESLSFEMFTMDQYHLYRTVPLIENDASIPRILVVIENITTQKNMAKEKAQLENQLRQAQKMEAIGTLAGGIAHDFNNILAIILGNIELCLDDSVPIKHIHMNMTEAQTACIRARDLIRQILNFSRQSYPNIEPLIITSIIKESVRLLRASVPANIHIDTDIPDMEDTIMGNPTQVNQVLLNLCANAVYAMGDEGTLKIYVSHLIPQKISTLINKLENKPYVKISVNDSGAGISKNVISKIFDPYFTTKKVGDGSGMGLSLVYSIIQAHKGAITVESIQGKGTTFVIYLPVVQHQHRVKPDPSAPVPKGTGNILFVDDEEMLVRVGMRMLTKLGYTVIGYHNPVDAFADFESRPNDYDLIITDMTMPGMSGKILSQKILSIRPEIPIIICSGYSESMDESFCKKMGVRHFLLKPLSKRILAEKVYPLIMTS